MKKLTFATVVLCAMLTFSNCKKEQMLAGNKTYTTVKKIRLALADILVEPRKNDKANLGQADGEGS